MGPFRERSAPEQLIELALLAIEQDAIDLAAEAMTHVADGSTHKTSTQVNELLALQPKIPAAYLRLFAEGTRTGLTHAIRAQIDTLKKRSLADATEVYGQLGLRAPKLRKTYGTLVDPLLNGDGTTRKTPMHWGWLGGGLVVVLSLSRMLASQSLETSSASWPAINVEVSDEQEAALGSAVNLICADRPERCDDARRLSESLGRRSCAGGRALVERLTVGDLNDAAGDASRLLQHRFNESCGAAPQPD